MDINKLHDVFSGLARSASRQAADHLPAIKDRMHQMQTQTTIERSEVGDLLHELLDLCIWDVGKAEFFELLNWVKPSHPDLAIEYKQLFDAHIRDL